MLLAPFLIQRSRSIRLKHTVTVHIPPQSEKLSDQKLTKADLEFPIQLGGKNKIQVSIPVLEIIKESCYRQYKISFQCKQKTKKKHIYHQSTKKLHLLFLYSLAAVAAVAAVFAVAAVALSSVDGEKMLTIVIIICKLYNLKWLDKSDYILQVTCLKWVLFHFIYRTMHCR